MLEVFQQEVRFTTIELKNVYFYVDVAPKHRFLSFVSQSNRILFSYS